MAGGFNPRRAVHDRRNRRFFRKLAHYFIQRELSMACVGCGRRGLVDKKNCAGSIQATGDAHSALPPRRSARLRGAGRLRESREGVGASPAFSSRQPRTPRRSLAFNPPRRCWREGRPVRPEPRHYQGADVVLLTRGAPVFRLYSARIPLIFPSYSSMNSQAGLAPASVWRIPILYLR